MWPAVLCIITVWFYWFYSIKRWYINEDILINNITVCRLTVCCFILVYICCCILCFVFDEKVSKHFTAHVLSMIEYLVNQIWICFEYITLYCTVSTVIHCICILMYCLVHLEHIKSSPSCVVRWWCTLWWSYSAVVRNYDRCHHLFPPITGICSSELI